MVGVVTADFRAAGRRAQRHRGILARVEAFLEFIQQLGNPLLCRLQIIIQQVGQLFVHLAASQRAADITQFLHGSPHSFLPRPAGAFRSDII